MDNVGNLALSMAAMMSRATDVTANNIANANTGGFKGSRIQFEKLIADTGSRDQMAEIAYSIDRGTWSDLSDGAMIPTGNDLDMSIQGDGFFAYERTDGQRAMGRDGSFAMTPEGDLVTTGGDSVLDIGGAPINIPPGSGSVSVARDGTISTEIGGVIGQVGVFAEPEIGTWRKLGGGMFAPRDGDIALTPSIAPSVLQGVTEASNVSPVLEMTRMIEQQRAYERAITLADGANKLRSETLQRLGNR